MAEFCLSCNRHIATDDIILSWIASLCLQGLSADSSFFCPLLRQRYKASACAPAGPWRCRPGSDSKQHLVSELEGVAGSVQEEADH